MGWLDLPYLDAPEWIDALDAAPEDLAASMADVAFTNRLFGGTSTIVGHVKRLLANISAGSTIRLLDIGTGSADIPVVLLRWARKRGLKMEIVALDNHPGMLRIAQRAIADAENLWLVRGSAEDLPFAPKSFDVATCALAFHHFGFDGSTHVLSAMDRLTTRGFVVADLCRDRISLAGVGSAVTLMRAHPFTKHDACASVYRSFTPQEYRKMIALCGTRDVRVYRHWYYRLALVQQKRI